MADSNYCCTKESILGRNFPVGVMPFACMQFVKATNCFGLIDGTVRSICCLGEMEIVVYNGHKRKHALKLQSMATPIGLIANLFGPVEDCRHDSGMLADSYTF